MEIIVIVIANICKIVINCSNPQFLREHLLFCKAIYVKSRCLSTAIYVTCCYLLAAIYVKYLRKQPTGPQADIYVNILRLLECLCKKCVDV